MPCFQKQIINTHTAVSLFTLSLYIYSDYYVVLKLGWAVNKELNVSSSHDKDCNENMENDSLSPSLWQLQGEQEMTGTKAYGFRFIIMMDGGQVLEWIVFSFLIREMHFKTNLRPNPKEESSWISFRKILSGNIDNIAVLNSQREPL